MPRHLANICSTSRRDNFGYPIRVFLARLTSALAKDRAGLAAGGRGECRQVRGRSGRITSPRRNVLRVRGYFATVYAVGCLAIRFSILPFTEAELLAAILSCHRDHVAFVDNEVAGGPSWTNEAAGAQVSVAAGSARKPVCWRCRPPADDPLRPPAALYQSQPRRRLPATASSSPALADFAFKLRAKRSKGALSSATSPTANTGSRVLGSRRSPGAPARPRRSRRTSTAGELLETDKRGQGVSYVVKRLLPDGSRPFFVVVRHNAKKPWRWVSGARVGCARVGRDRRDDRSPISSEVNGQRSAGRHCDRQRRRDFPSSSQSRQTEF